MNLLFPLKKSDWPQWLCSHMEAINWDWVAFEYIYTHTHIYIIKKLNAEELMLSNCGAGENSWESLGLLGDQIS